MQMDSYDIALVCRNGHMVNDSSRDFPQFNEKFCRKCGAETISECPKCKKSIRGRYHGGGMTLGRYDASAYCHECGAPFPWTDARRKALSELLAMSSASDADQAALRDSLPALAAESPGTPVAIAKWRKFLGGAGKQMASSFRDLIVEIAAEAVKRKMFPE